MRTKARLANRVATGDARCSDRRVDGERLLRRLEAALNGLPARIAGAGAAPWKAGGEL
jgi:hypothetical protein